MDKLALAEALETENLIIGLQGLGGEALGGACELAHHLAGLVHGGILIELIQIHLDAGTELGLGLLVC